MKSTKHWMVGTAALFAAATLAFGADDLLPGQVDFGTFSPPKGEGEFVEVNVPTGLITMASKLVEKEDADVAKLLSGLKLVRVNVIGVDDENRSEIQQRAQKIRGELSAKGWERVVAVQQKDQDVSVYLKMDAKGAIQGLTAVILADNQQAVFANVVGEIKPEQLSMLGEKLHIDPLKNISKKFENSEDKPKTKEPEKPEKSEDK